ncbi:MAG: periplasmic heavy metal sensor [Deltaproteobacteria bacterium]|jgi:uncharacterized membrane protein|nr:periplasmic heavy metal sensor [Deltaproteobacteria bacterium]MBW2532702.1 periplasmic heavy metal sensor [Deltaproteobacteria bacterium]
MSQLLAKKWAIALVVSLALNLFLGGMMTGRWMSKPPAPPGHGMGMRVRSVEASLRRHLDPSVHGTLKEIDAKHQETIRTHMKEANQASRRASKALVAEPFDEEAARQAFAEARAKQAAARKAMQDALVELAAALPPGERKKLRKALGRGEGRRGKGMRRRPRRGAPE